MGSFPVDIDLRIDPASALKAYKEFTAKANALMKDLAAGVEGADKKLQQAHENFARSVISTSTRAGRAIESSIKSLERQAEMAGKTRSEQLLVRQEKWIKMLGEDEAAVKRVTAAFGKLVKAEEEAERKSKHGGILTGTGPGSMFVRGSRDIFEGRVRQGLADYMNTASQLMGGGTTAAGGALAGAGIAIGGITAALAGFTAAAYHAAESVGEYGMKIHEVQVSTGMTAREVQTFRLAAEMTGHDVDMVNKVMRGLTQAMEGTSEGSSKARDIMRSFGVDLLGLKTGAITTGEAFMKIGEGLKNDEDAWKRNADAQALFKRASGETIGTLIEFANTAKEVQDRKFFSQEQIDRMVEMHKQITLLKLDFEELAISIKTAVVNAWTFTKSMADVQRFSMSAILGVGRGWLNPQAPVPAPPSADPARRILQEQRDAITNAFGKYIEGIGSGTSIEAAERKLSRLKKAFEDTATNNAENLEKYYRDQSGFKADVESKRRAVDQQQALVESLKTAESNRKALDEALRRLNIEVEDRLQHPFELPSEAARRKALSMPGMDRYPKRAEIERQHDILVQQEKTEQANKLQRQMLETQQTVEREMARAARGGVGQVDIRDLGRHGVTRTDVEADINRQYDERMDIAQKLFKLEYDTIKAREINTKDTVALEQQRRDIVAATGHLAVAQIEAENARKREGIELTKREFDLAEEHRLEMSRLLLADREIGIKAQADLERKRAQLHFRGDNPAAGIMESYRIAREESQKLYQLEMDRIALEETGYKAEEDRQRALMKLHREDEAARIDTAYKLAEMQQHQLDTIKQKVEPLYHTLFTDPKNFGQQLKTTVRDAALKPIESGLSEMTARALYPTIYGQTGTGGLAGIFRDMFSGQTGGRLNDVKLTPRGAVPVEVVNTGGGGGGGWGGSGGGTSPTPWTLPMPPASIWGGPLRGIFGGGGGRVWSEIPPTGPLGGMPIPNWSVGFGGMGPSYSPMGAAGMLGPGGTSGFAGPLGGWGLPLSSANTGYDLNMAGMNAGMGGWGGGGGGGAAAGLLGMGVPGLIGKGLGGIGAGLGKLFPSIFGHGYGSIFGGESVPALGLAGKLGLQRNIATGRISGMGGLGGAALLTGGTMLAGAGIFGERRGTGLGILEAAGGGAMIGMKFGGPIGALIGTGVGAAIGLGEMLAGAESPRHEAKRLVKETYHIDINNSTADQIVAIAKQSYAGRVSIAVRSPEVRHMLGLYAAGTGQASSFPAAASEAHGASLVESGGHLMQQSVYQYGQAYAYSSNLPLYGGGSANPLSAPGGNVSLSLNIGGQDASKFMTGQVVTPEVVQSKYQESMYASGGRVPQALMLNQPGAIAS